MKLFESGKIGKLNIKNRIVMAPMGIGGLAQSDGTLSQRGIDYYVARAQGGVGLIISGACRVSRKIEQLPMSPFVPHFTVDNRIFVSWLDELADAVHDYGAKIALQLSAGAGRVISRQYGIEPPVAPSALPWLTDLNIKTRELTTKEVDHLVQAFGFAAEVISAAGIDAIELHCHGGYLIDQFLTTLWNKRNDKYGGDLNGRMTFLLEIIQRIRKVLGQDFPLIVRLSLTHYFEGAREVEEGVEIARRIEAAGVDALSIDAGCYETLYWLIPSEFQPRGCIVNLADIVKKAVNIPVIVAGKLGYPQLAEKVLKDGGADFIALGRPLLADPEWVNKVKEGRLEDIRPCIGCLEGCRRRIYEGKAISCAVNPTTGKERELTVNLAKRKKKVLVIGGGPAGMEAARVSALRDHKVSLWEKSDILGGNLKAASGPSFKQDYRSLINYLSTQIKRLGVSIELRKEATPETIQEMEPDVVFIAAGSTPIIPEIPGIRKKKVLTAIDVLLGKKEVGEKIVIIGGGTAGCEAALHISQRCENVTIVEILDDVARDMYLVNRVHLIKLLADSGVKILPNTSIQEITDEGVIIADQFDKRIMLAADTVVIAIGMQPNNDLLRALTEKVPEVFSLGDCVEPRRVINAIWEGFRFARLI